MGKCDKCQSILPSTTSASWLFTCFCSSGNWCRSFRWVGGRLLQSPPPYWHHPLAQSPLLSSSFFYGQSIQMLIYMYIGHI
jgi:hypothetical protein